MSEPERGQPSVRLADGRSLAYHELGDPDGAPVLYCHGFPSSGREAWLLDETARGLGARVIAPDRPGYGRSDHQASRSIKSFASDLAELADRLGIGRFALIGVSGGAPYALGAAWRLGDRIAACALVCPLGPVYLPEVLAEMGLAARVQLALARTNPLVAYAFTSRIVADLLARWPRSVDRLRSFAGATPDRAALASDGTRAVLNDTIADAVSGGALGARQDLLLYTRDWAIPFDAISVPVRLWHGTADEIVPITHAQWYGQRLPGSAFIALADEGHYSLPLRHAHPILAALMRDAAD